jgi:hypothetical protein
MNLIKILDNIIKAAANPLLAGDANGDCHTSGTDVTYLVRFFKGIGSAPRRCSN